MTQILEKCFPNPDNGGQTAADSRDIFFFSAVNQELRSYLHASIRAHTHTHTHNLLFTLLNALSSRGHQFCYKS